MITLIATLFPATGKKDLVLQSLLHLSSIVQANEPDCLEYSVHVPARDTSPDEDEIICVERYRNMEAVIAHGKKEYLVEAKKKGKEEGALRKETVLKVMKEAGGFGWRG